jgi:hypothetical protein
MRKSMLTLGVCGALAALGAAPAFAGEVTPSGANSNQNQGVSWCSFSGANDDPTAPIPPDEIGPNGPGGHSQSYGQENRLGLQDPPNGNPGTFCNPNRTPLPPQPNRTK